MAEAAHAVEVPATMAAFAAGASGFQRDNRYSTRFAGFSRVEGQ